ncbi:MAG TPA: universal stress protein [Desulfurivibrionaceae bacterium]|nr:universal stress protein [Desulfurivibrionaceae bacterium]
MKVVAAVNGLITSEVAALYALRYAALYDCTLVLLHVDNPRDARGEVEAGMVVVEEAAEGYGVKTERLFLQGRPAMAIASYLAQTPTDTLFCSTRMRNHYFEASLSERLSRLDLPANLAVVRVARIEAWALTREVVMPIREERLSVQKFVFFASMAKTLGAAAEIYSISPVNRSRQAALDLAATRELFQRINERLSHYSHALRLSEVEFRIKHALATDEINQILHHLSHHDCQLLIVGGRRLSRHPRLLGESLLERLFRHTPVNTIAFYARNNK